MRKLSEAPQLFVWKHFYTNRAFLAIHHFHIHLARILFNFSWVLHSSQEKLKTMVIWEVNKVRGLSENGE